MITACLFEKGSPPGRASLDKAQKVSVKTPQNVLIEGQLRCCECLESVGLVHRGETVNHFRHHPRTQESPPCRFRSDGRSKPHKAETLKVDWKLIHSLKTGNTKLRRELEQARKLIAHLTEENAQSRQELEQVRAMLVKVNLQLGKVERLLKSEQQEEAHDAAEIILHVKEGLKAA